jgi:hypothetical protein
MEHSAARSRRMGDYATGKIGNYPRGGWGVTLEGVLPASLF